MISESSDCFKARSTASYSSRSMSPGIHRKEIEDREEVTELVRMWIR